MSQLWTEAAPERGKCVAGGAIPTKNPNKKSRAQVEEDTGCVETASIAALRETNRKRILKVEVSNGAGNDYQRLYDKRIAKYAKTSRGEQTLSTVGQIVVEIASLIVFTFT